MTQSSNVDGMRRRIAILQSILNRDFHNSPLLGHDKGFFFDGAGGWKSAGWLVWRAECIALCGDLALIEDLKKLASELESLCSAPVGSFTLDVRLKADLEAVDRSLANSPQHLSPVPDDSIQKAVPAESSLQDVLRQLEIVNRRIDQLEAEHARTRRDLEGLTKELGG